MIFVRFLVYISKLQGTPTVSLRSVDLFTIILSAGIDEIYPENKAEFSTWQGRVCLFTVNPVDTVWKTILDFIGEC